MRFKFITALQKVTVPDSLGNGDKIGDEMRISNDPKVKSTFLTDGFQSMVGVLEFKHLNECNVFLYSSEEVPEDTNPLEYLNSKMYCAQDLLMATWLKSDNCINFELCFLITEKGQSFGVTSNFLSHRYHAASGNDEEIKLSRKQLQTIRKIHIERLGIKSDQSPIPDSQFLPDNLRLGRALTWMNAARGNFDFSVRVANFCTALETLFSTSSSEIAHQLSERVSTFLEEKLEERLAVYKKVKKAYELRSRIVHGSTTTKKASKNPKDTSIEIESISKRVVLKIVENDAIFEAFNTSDEELGALLLSMVLNGKTPGESF